MPQFTDLTDEQLAHKVIENERSLVGLKFQHSMSTLENTSRLGKLKKDIARLKTEARRRELEKGLNKDSLVQSHAKTFTKPAPEAKATTEQAAGGFLSGIVDKLTGKE
jgi:large subunit ribosomal protein L29